VAFVQLGVFVDFTISDNQFRRGEADIPCRIHTAVSRIVRGSASKVGKSNASALTNGCAAR